MTTLFLSSSPFFCGFKVDGLATNLTAFMANVTNSLAALQQQLTTLDGRVGGLDTRLQASVMEAASNLSTVKTELAGSLTGLTKSLGDAAANITQLQAATSGLAGLDARVQSLEGQDTGTAVHPRATNNNIKKKINK